jgi:hypothetical protein
MTPKEKAEEILNKFSKTHIIGVENTKGKLINPYISGYASVIVRNNRAKQSAVIAVDFQLEFLEGLYKPEYTAFDCIGGRKLSFESESEDSLNGYELIDYLKQVKTEIKKL